MKQPVVDYRKFRFSKLNDPEFSHLKLLAGWLVYFLFYFLTENFIPYDACHVMHSRLDDLIPFNEFFFIPYCFWYVLIVYLVLLAAGMILIRPVWGSLAFVGALLIFWYYHHIAMKYFGGTTGDISGFFLCICEVGMALILAVFSNF